MAKGRPNRQKPVHRPAGERGRPAGERGRPAGEPAAGPGAARSGPGPAKSGRPGPTAGTPSASRAAPRGTARPAGPHPSPDRDVVYGRNPVREALRGRRRVSAVYVTEGSHGHDVLADVETWIQEGRKAREADLSPPPRVTVLAPDELDRRLGTSDHQGVAAQVTAYPYVEPAELLEALDLIVVLDRVQDPHNLGAVVRTAEAAGAGVVIPRHRAAGVTGAVARAAAGATEHILIAQARNLTDFLAAAKAAGFWTYGAASDAFDPYDGPDYRDKTVFVLGSEGGGLARRVRESCDLLVHLPLEGRVESLNVSVTAGILVYEALRQRRASS